MNQHTKQGKGLSAWPAAAFLHILYQNSTTLSLLSWEEERAVMCEVMEKYKEEKRKSEDDTGNGPSELYTANGTA